MDNTQTYNNPLGTERISKLIARFSVPAIVGMLVNSLYNIVDRIYIGNSPDLGQNGLGGITVVFPLMLISLAIGVLFGSGGATAFSIKLGQKDTEGAEKVLGNAFLMLVLSSTTLMILGKIFLKQIISFLGASEVILPYAYEYMSWILVGSVFATTSLGLNNFMRADGSPRTAMMTMFLGAGTNIILDPIFIYGFKMGMAGAAIATIISQFFSFVWVVAYFTGKRSIRSLRFKNLKPDYKILKSISTLGMPPFALQLVGSMLNSILNKSLLFYGGDIAISGMGIINSLQTLMFMPIIGLNQGLQPIISFNFGARKFDRVKKAAFMGAGIATAITTSGFLLVRFFPTLLISMFNRTPQLVEFTKPALLAWMLCMPIIGFQIIFSNFFQAIARPGVAIFLTLTRQLIFLIPSIIILPRIWGISGLWYAAPLSDALAAMLTGVWFYFGIKGLQKHADKADKGKLENQIEIDGIG